MAKKYTDVGFGTLGKNGKKRLPTQPDILGSITWGGVKTNIAAWERRSLDGDHKYYTFALSQAIENGDDDDQANDAASSTLLDDDDDDNCLPF